ncbi:MAG: DUF2254 family protein [Bacilli bacterium]
MVSLIKKMALHALTSGTVIALIFALSPKGFVGDTDTARNYLSTIVSCLSTILALCISITLVAIQLTASRYTHRVLDLFLKLPFNISLILFYFVTIIQSLFLLSRIQEPIRETLPGYLQPQMTADMILVLFCFAILIAYLYAVMQLLKPERIVAEIERECRYAILRRRDLDALAKVEQICDIAKRAAGDMDSTTGLVAIHALEKLAAEGVRAPRASVTRQFVEIAVIAAKEREGGMLGSVMAALYTIGAQALASDRMQDARAVIHAYERIVRTALVGQRLMPFIEEAVAAMFRLAGRALRERARHATKEQALFAQNTFHAIREIGDEVLASEDSGESFVARSILSVDFGRLLRSLERAAPLLPAGLWPVYIDYGNLAKRLIEKAKLSDLAPVTTWLRSDLDSSVKRGDGARCQYGVALMVCALSHAARREGAQRLIVHAVASVAPLSSASLSDLSGNYRLWRSLFDYADPRPHLQAAATAWNSYRRFWPYASDSPHTDPEQ